MTKKIYTVGFLFSPDLKRVILIEKKQPKWQYLLKNGVGGKLEPGEKPYDCMVREFKEETGLEIKDWNEFCTINGSETNSEEYTVFFYYGKAKSDGEFLSYESTTKEKVSHYQVSRLPKTVPNLRWLIPMALNVHNSEEYCKGFEIEEVK